MGQQGSFFVLPTLVILGAGCTGSLVATSSDQPGQQADCVDPATCVQAVSIASRRDVRANPRARRPWQDAGEMLIEDAGTAPIDDAGTVSPEPTPEPDAGDAPLADAGVTSPTPDAGTPPTACVAARRLWFEDFETGDYSRWSGGGYGAGWGDGCQSNGLSTARAHSGTTSNRSEITCGSHTDVHRGYGGVQFSGDTPLSSYTNSGVGIDAPHGVVNTFWTWLDVPYDFGSDSGRWMSLWTTNSDCGWGERVLTLGLENASRRLTPAHVTSTGGTVTFSPGAPALPLRQWVRITVYVNYQAGEMHVWQDGVSVVHATFSRPTDDICQWHWGAYASGDNTDIELFEDDKSIWKLGEAWTDMTTEPWFEGPVTACP